MPSWMPSIAPDRTPQQLDYTVSLFGSDKASAGALSGSRWRDLNPLPASQDCCGRSARLSVEMRNPARGGCIPASAMSRRCEASAMTATVDILSCDLSENHHPMINDLPNNSVKWGERCAMFRWSSNPL